MTATGFHGMSPYTGYRIQQYGKGFIPQRRVFFIWWDFAHLPYNSVKQAEEAIRLDIMERNPRIVWSEGMFTANVDEHPALKGTYK